MTDARITSTTPAPTSIVSHGRMASALSGAVPDFSGLLQAFAQPLTDETPAPSPAPIETPTDRDAASTPEDETEDQPARRDTVKAVRVTTPAPAAPRAESADEPEDDAPPVTDNLACSMLGADSLAPAAKQDGAADGTAVPVEVTPPPEPKPDDAVLAWLVGQQAVATPKIVASQKATPAPTESAATADAAAPITAVATAAPTPQGAPVETALAPTESDPAAAPAPDFKQPALPRATVNQNIDKPEDAVIPVTTADASSVTSTVLPPPIKSVEPEATRALAAQAVPEGNSGNAPSPIAPPQGIAPVTATAVPLPVQTKTAEVARSQEETFGALDAASGTRSLNGYHSTTQLAASRTTRTGGAQAAAVVEQVAIKLHQQAQSGLDQLTIQLRPADLGRVDVRLQFHDGGVTGTIVADSQATLDLLQKDQRSLERALQESGLRTEPGALSFALRDQSGQGQQTPSNGRGASRSVTAEVLVADTTAADGEPAVITANRVNLRV